MAQSPDQFTDQSTIQSATLPDWIKHDAKPFSIDLENQFQAVVDHVMDSLGSSVKLLGLGEALHGSEEILILRNRLFQHLVQHHGFTAIAIESSFPRAYVVNEYIAGRGTGLYEDVKEAGFSHGFGKLDANRELIEWMKQYNATHSIPIRFDGFDSPTEMIRTDSPRQLLNFAMNYLSNIDATTANGYRERMDSHLGGDGDWENSDAMYDPGKSIGLSSSANALRIETEELITELKRRRPELVGSGGESELNEAIQHATLARQMLTYHAAMARPTADRISVMLGMRDMMMADNLAYMVAREEGRGKVFAFGHNSHLQRGMAHWQLGPQLLKWWPAGAHLDQMLGHSYAVIGMGLGYSDDNGIGLPEANTLESLLTVHSEKALFIPTHGSLGIDLSNLPIRTGSTLNPTYFALSSRSLTDFNYLVVLKTTTYHRGGSSLRANQSQ